jgi:hypothetical protein
VPVKDLRGPVCLSFKFLMKDQESSGVVGHGHNRISDVLVEVGENP